MTTQSKKAPQIHVFLNEQEQATWHDFWARLDRIDELLHQTDFNLGAWRRCPRLGYSLWRLKGAIEKLNRVFGRG